MPFHRLTWHRVFFALRNKRLSPATRAHPLIIIESILKGTRERCRGFKGITVFHFAGSGRPRLRWGGVYEVVTLFFSCTEDAVLRWLDALGSYLSSDEGSLNYDLESIGIIEERDLAKLKEEIGEMPEEGEICLEFLTPLAFHHPPKKRTSISSEELIEAFVERSHRLFGSKAPDYAACDEFQIIDHLWHFTEIAHRSGSQPGDIHKLKGCVGKLYLRGRFKHLLPFLILGSEIHAGRRLSFGVGRYRLHPTSCPHFDTALLNPALLGQALHEVLELDEAAAAEIATSGEDPFEDSALVGRLVKELREGTYEPSPYRAFRVAKKHGGERVIEQASMRDLIVQRAIHRIVQRPFDRLFEPESIGYRKGMSHDRAVELIRQARDEGYRYVVEADIEDFFESVDHDRLGRLLDSVLPKADVCTRQCIQGSFKMGFVLNGRECERSRGLPQGSPLSPLLANLYLDSFDEEVKKLGARLVRYADDFVILTKTEEEARNLLEQAGDILAAIELRLAKGKTFIRSLDEGFDFLGIHFAEGEASIGVLPESMPYRKPLYISEPYVSIGVNGDAIEVRKAGVVLERIPLRRLSEIIVMVPASVSTALIQSCSSRGVPITLTHSDGYHINTFRPDSRRYHSISAEQVKRYESMSAAERLAIGKDIASSKLANYITLFRLRYEKGTSCIIDELRGLMERISLAATIDQVRGYEGIASKRIYAQLNAFIRDPSFHIVRRRRLRPDPINSLLNFHYYLLFSRVNATVRALGLNPYLGFLHSPADDYESLVCDIEELFRAQIDRLVIKLVNLKVVRSGDFQKHRKGCRLKRAALRRCVDHFEKELARIPRSGKPSLGTNIYMQALVLKQWAVEGRSIALYRWGR